MKSHGPQAPRAHKDHYFFAGQEFANRHSAGLSQNVPAGDIQAALHIRMAFQRSVHPPIEFRQFPRILAEKVRTQFAQSSAHAFSISRQIERAERTDFAISNEAGVRLHAHDSATENRHGLPPLHR